MASIKEAVSEKAEEMAAFLKEAKDFPMVKMFRAEQAAALRAKRKDADKEIKTLKKEQAEAIPRLLASRDAKEAKWKEAKAALDAAGLEFNAARFAVSTASQSFSGAISGQEMILLETHDPALDEANTFFTEKLAWLRTAGRISRNAIGAESNIVTETKMVKSESNINAVNEALRYCQDAIKELERMKLEPVLDVEKIKRMKTGIPNIDVYAEYTGEKSTAWAPPSMVHRFGGASDDAYEQTLIDRVLARADDLLSKPAKPPLAKKRGETGVGPPRKEATMETYRKRAAGYFAAEGTYNYRGDKT